MVSCEPSRFLDELPADDVRHTGKSVETDHANRRALAATREANIRAMLGKG